MAAGSRYKESALGHPRTRRKLAPGYSLLQRLLQLLNRGARKNGALVAQQIIRMYFFGLHQLHPVEIARTEHQGPSCFLVYQKGGPLGIELVEGSAIGFSLRVCQLQALDHGQLAIGQLGSQRGAQGPEQLLARKSVVVTMRLGPVNSAPMAPDRRPHGTYASTAGTLLLPQL